MSNLEQESLLQIQIRTVVMIVVVVGGERGVNSCESVDDVNVCCAVTCGERKRSESIKGRRDYDVKMKMK